MTCNLCCWPWNGRHAPDCPTLIITPQPALQTTERCQTCKSITPNLRRLLYTSRRDWFQCEDAFHVRPVRREVKA